MAVNAILCAFLIRAITSNCIFMNLKVFLFSAALLPCVAFAQTRVSSPDGNLEVSVSGNGGKPTYSVTYKGKTYPGAKFLPFLSSLSLNCLYIISG